jgi:hypothetical protein
MKDQSFERPQVEYRHITLRCILVLVAACGLVLGTFYPGLGTASYGGLVGVLALITAIVLLAIQGRWRGLAAWLVVLGGVVATGVVWRFYPWAGMPTILVFPVIVGAAVLGLWGSLAAALLASALLIGASSGALQLPIERGAFLAATLMVWASFIVTALMTWQQSASIASALEGYNQARNSLAQARDRQLELN